MVPVRRAGCGQLSAVKLRGCWAVEDAETGAVWTGMVQVGARQLAHRLNGDTDS
ncbi:hypothetical protein [Streptomyces sp. NPDC059708]|uniref:hypothetical protein n=1 Tax=Streptomyces sp. NPDC059708 TaxID=3346916 RepID=UPI003679A85D